MTQPDIRIVVTCPHCGADTEFLTGGSRYHWQRACVIRCTECAWTGAVNVELSTISGYEAATERSRISREARAIKLEAEHIEAVSRTRRVLAEAS